jgi:hypothetical protein
MHGKMQNKMKMKYLTGLDSTRLKDVILEYYFYHGFGLKAFEGCHIRIVFLC